jgi:hypothetical protein
MDDNPYDQTEHVPDTSGLVQMDRNYKCTICGDVFAKARQVSPHVIRKHKKHSVEAGDIVRTNEPVTRTQILSWREINAQRDINKTLRGPFTCCFCGHEAEKLQGMAIHIGRHHKGEHGGRPFKVGTHYTASGTKRAEATKRAKSVGSQVKQALTSGKPTITIDIDLWEGVSIRVPLVLGPPVFIERTNDG